MRSRGAVCSGRDQCADEPPQLDGAILSAANHNSGNVALSDLASSRVDLWFLNSSESYQHDGYRHPRSLSIVNRIGAVMRHE
jgi:hypothetical protein